MIVKHIAIRNLNKSSFSGLVNYITHAQQKNERVGQIRITNCQSESPAWVAIEVEAVQRQNKRSLVDKTYHMLVSFREGENPSPETLRVIEERLCAALGYGEHQRISAVHHDTDHLHIHIAINKVHPVRLTTHQPYRDYKIIAALCPQLEKDYQLAADNHVAQLSPGEAKAQDMEKAAGIESLIGWVKRGCLPELLISGSWEELHAVLARHGLQLAQRGNGLVITDGNGIAAKASSIHRSLSKQALEKRLGGFQPSFASHVPITARYAPIPMVSKIDTGPLWVLYQQERQQQKQRHAVLLTRARERKLRRMANARKAAQAKRATIAFATKGRIAQTLLYRSVAESFLHELRGIRQDYRTDTQQVYAKGKPLVWYDWLKAKAWQGNGQALEVLRHRYERGPLQVNSIAGEAIDRVNYRTGAKIEAVTKRGTIHYQIAQTVLRDDGKLLRLAEHVSPEAVTAALKIATQRFGPSLAIQGTDAFRAQVVEVAATAKLHLVFTDPAMEIQRKALMGESIATVLSAEEAADQYITERTATREKGVDLLPHRRYVAADTGSHAYAGLRHIEGHTLMLLQTKSEILVLPVDDVTARHTNQLTIGDKIEVNALGKVRTRTRKM